MKTLKELNEEMQYCEKCEIGLLDVNKYVDGKNGFGKLPITGSKFKYVFVGQNPSVKRFEFSAFCGRTSGDTFAELLTEVGIKPEDVAILNMVKCSTISNQPPDAETIKTCTDTWLAREFEIMNPHLIIAMGRTVCDFFGVKLGGFGRWNKLRVAGIYHPAVLKYDPSMKPRMMEMLKVVRTEIYDGVKLTKWFE